MTSVTDDLPLGADFAPATFEDWRKLVDGVLKGAPFERLQGKTYDGLRIEPIYTRARAAAPIAGAVAADRDSWTETGCVARAKNHRSSSAWTTGR